MSRRRGWRAWHIVLVVLAGMVMFAVGWIGLVVVSLSGGFDDVFALDRPEQGDPEVVAAQRAASRRLEADADRLTFAVTTPALGAGAAPVGRGEVTGPCQVGQHNWKIDDDFDLACDLVRIEVVAAGRRDTFATDMMTLDAALQADDWTSELFSMDRVVAAYGGRIGNAHSSVPGTAPTPAQPSYPPGYGVDDLPSAQYAKTIDGERRTLSISWAETGSRPDAVTFLDEWATFHHANGSDTDAAGLVAAIPEGGYAVVLTELLEYFRG